MDSVTQSWKFHAESKAKASDRDFIKLNRMGIKEGALNSRAMGKFREHHDV